MTHYGYLRTIINVNGAPTNKEITLALDEQDARITELEKEKANGWTVDGDQYMSENTILKARIAELTEERDRWKQHYEYSKADSARLAYIKLYQTDPVAIRFALKASAEEVFKALTDSANFVPAPDLKAENTELKDRIVGLESEVKMWIEAALRWEKRAIELNRENLILKAVERLKKENEG